MILEMKKVAVFALRSDRDKILKALQRRSLIMIEQNDKTVTDKRLGEADQKLAEADDAIRFIAPYSNEKGGLLAPKPEITPDELSAAAGDSEVAQQIRALEEQLSSAKSELASREAQLKQAIMWKDCRVTKEELEACKSCRVITGYIPTISLDSVQQLIEDEPAAIEVYSGDFTSYAVAVVAYGPEADKLEEQLKDIDFIKYTPPFDGGSPAQAVELLNAEIERGRQAIADMDAKALELGKKSQELKRLYDQRESERELYAAPFLKTDSTFCITGWVEAKRSDEVEKTLSGVTDVYEIEITDPAEGEQPPTLVKNNSVVTPFETLTDMFSRPNPLEGIDPNPVMAPWYWIIFGMMMADVGYGLMMAVLFTVFIKLKKPTGESAKLMRVLQFASITTAFWGVMFGSYFGEELLPAVLFVPLNNPMPMLVMSFALGALHIFCGLIMNAIQLIKQKKLGEAIGKDLGWIFLISGLPMLILPSVQTVGKIVSIAGLAMIVLFTKSGERNPIKRIFGGISALTGVTGFMSDILSYSRIVALMLASGVIAMVMNILAGMVAAMPIIGIVFSLVVYIIGHVFNLAMGLLSAYVHASRLQYIEFYSKFYEGGGYEFTPLSCKTTYNTLSNKN